MCGLRTCPRTDVDPPRVELPSAWSACGISSRRPPGDNSYRSRVDAQWLDSSDTQSCISFVHLSTHSYISQNSAATCFRCDVIIIVVTLLKKFTTRFHGWKFFGTQWKSACKNLSIRQSFRQECSSRTNRIFTVPYWLPCTIANGLGPNLQNILRFIVRIS